MLGAMAISLCRMLQREWNSEVVDLQGYFLVARKAVARRWAWQCLNFGDTFGLMRLLLSTSIDRIDRIDRMVWS
jgi:hypothetical protein